MLVKMYYIYMFISSSYTEQMFSFLYKLFALSEIVRWDAINCYLYINIVLLEIFYVSFTEG